MKWPRCKPEPRPRKAQPCLNDPNCALVLGYQWCTCHSSILTAARNGHDHWLTFADDGCVSGCNCGFVADMEADGGYGDSVVEHLLNVSGGAA